MTINFNIIVQTGGTFTLLQPHSFYFVKDVYTPYTELTISYYYSTIENPVRAKLTIDGKLIHDGIIVSAKHERNADKQLFTIKSRGFTSLLTQNEITPGLYSGITFNQLMDNYITIPNVAHENNTSGTNYIYVKIHDSMWEGIVNYCYKVYGRYPYISGPNTVMVSQKASPVTYNKTAEDCYAFGQEQDYSNLISHFHMSDIDDNYNAYNLTNTFATAKNISRHKHYDLDRQYLSNPNQALDFHSKYSQRRTKSNFCQYYGYGGEDLNDIINLTGIGNLSNKRISRIEIKSVVKYTMTKISAFSDGFNN
ncbi:hypothetical protein FACS1894132_02410 [Clostridia bacterium]|nr:hypothetical protein FACS1894132_02410 [Clostridia bacterium]